MKTVYLDKKERLRGWLLGPRGLSLSAIAVLLFFAPLFHETRSGRFILEPVRQAKLRSESPGQVTAVLADEGQVVSAGSPLLRVSNLELEQRAARVASDLRVAAARAIESRLHYADYAPLERQRQSLQRQNTELVAQLATLQVESPISGTVVTPRVRDLAGSYVQAGSEVIEVQDLSVLRARIYLPEFALRGVQVGSSVALKLSGAFQPLASSVAAIAPASSPIEAGLLPKEAYKGLLAPQFYSLAALLPNPSNTLKPGMTGTAKVTITRRSLAGFAWKDLKDLVLQKVW
jgi:multidrug resistance efflux pump